jgi:hypothetical protein
MRHFEGDLGHEDAMQKEHYVLNRLFKISEAKDYPLTEHPVLQPKETAEQFKACCWWNTNITTIWHLSYIPNVWDFKKKYLNHLKKSEMHSAKYLKDWYWAHLFGRYPKSEISIKDIPDVILREFGIDPDEVYLIGRQLELKHAVMAMQWNDYFKPKKILDLGSGMGFYLYFMEQFAECTGIEKDCSNKQDMQEQDFKGRCKR